MEHSSSASIDTDSLVGSSCINVGHSGLLTTVTTWLKIPNIGFLFSDRMSMRGISAGLFIPKN